MICPALGCVLSRIFSCLGDNRRLGPPEQGWRLKWPKERGGQHTRSWREQRSPGQTPSARGSMPPGPPGMEGPLHAQEDLIHRELYGVGEDRSNKTA